MIKTISIQSNQITRIFFYLSQFDNKQVQESKYCYRIFIYYYFFCKCICSSPKRITGKLKDSFKYHNAKYMIFFNKGIIFITLVSCSKHEGKLKRKSSLNTCVTNSLFHLFKQVLSKGKQILQKKTQQNDENVSMANISHPL